MCVRAHTPTEIHEIKILNESHTSASLKLDKRRESSKQRFSVWFGHCVYGLREPNCKNWLR